MDMWDDHVENKIIENEIKTLVTGPEYVFFFKKGEDVYGAPESSRVVFAKIKNEDGDDMPKGWMDEASFSADNLSSALKGHMVKTIFDKDDLQEINIIDDDEAIESLEKQKKPGEEVDIGDIKEPTDPNDAVNIIPVQEEE